jgi:hypothetical protein
MMPNITRFEKIIFYPVAVLSLLLNIANLECMRGSDSGLYPILFLCIESMALITLWASPWFRFLNSKIMLRSALWVCSGFLILRLIMLPFSLG